MDELRVQACSHTRRSIHDPTCSFGTRLQEAGTCFGTMHNSPTWLAPTIHTTLPRQACGGGARLESRVRSASALRQAEE